MTDIAIVDYGMGNLRSVSKALEHVAPTASIVITDDPEVVRKAGRVVVPGQGAMPDCLRELDKRGLRGTVRYAAMSKPFLGICIGLQMLCDSSEEGNVEGLGIVAGTVRRFPSAAMADISGQRFKVPHMGWNQVHQAIEHPLWKDIPTCKLLFRARLLGTANRNRPRLPPTILLFTSAGPRIIFCRPV